MMTSPSERGRKKIITMIPSPGMGHLIPLVELAKRLILLHPFSVTIFVPTIYEPRPLPLINFLQTLPTHIQFVLLPPVNFHDLAPHDCSRPEVRICLAMTRSLDSLRQSFRQLTGSGADVVAQVTDCFGFDAFGVAKEFGVPSYMYVATSAMNLQFMFNLPTLHEKVKCEYRDMPDPIILPGCVPLHGRDFVDPTQDRGSQAYKWILHHSKGSLLADGILLNSFMDLETDAIQDLVVRRSDRPPVYPIGPIIQSRSGESDDSSNGWIDKCLIEWLDNQPKESVVYVSFGSGGTICREQLEELAYGLEMSEERFVWVVRRPDETSGSGSYFSYSKIEGEEAFDYLPEGFVERIKSQERGVVLDCWGPQVKVLSHPSTGVFLTHCGWNSTLESLVHGVPLIVWPLYAEQRANAVLLTEGIGVALRPIPNINNIIERGEISRVIKCLMRSSDDPTVDKIRKKAQRLKNAAEIALSPFGSSTEMLAQVVLNWTSATPS